jgi:mannose-6-phosphate isomerase-like protein (cupin superfamily)
MGESLAVFGGLRLPQTAASSFAGGGIEARESSSDVTGHIVGWKKNIHSFPPIGSPDAGSYVTVTDLDLPIGFVSPYHVHLNEYEAYYVVEGEMDFYVGDERVRAESGAWVYGPRGIPTGLSPRERRRPGCYFSTHQRASTGSP